MLLLMTSTVQYLIQWYINSTSPVVVSEEDKLIIVYTVTVLVT